jgi:uncharacterized protein DUF1707
MPGPEPGGPRSPLADADRERLAALLREHYAQGSLSLDELRRRVGIVLAAEYSDEAIVAVAVPGPGWTPTAERFRDPSTKKIMRVWIDPADGSRHYVPDDG